MAQKSNTETLPAIFGARGLLITNNDELISRVHNQISKENFNVLVPETYTFEEGIELAINLVRLDPPIKTADGWEFGEDFWTMDYKKWQPRGKALSKIAMAAGIHIDAAKSGVDSESFDGERKVVSRRYKMVGYITTASGKRIEQVASYEYNYYADLEDDQFKIREKVQGSNKKVKTDKINWTIINQRRRFATQLTETGAGSRLIKKLIPELKSNYTLKETELPFIVASAQRRIDLSDPYVKRMIAQERIGAESASYGPKPIKADYTIEEEGKANGQGQEIQKAESQETESAPEEPPEEPPSVEEKRPSPEQIREAFHDECLQAGVKERADIIRSLGKKANHDITVSAKGKKLAPPENWEGGLQMNWIMYLAEKAGEIPPKPKGGE